MFIEHAVEMMAMIMESLVRVIAVLLNSNGSIRNDDYVVVYIYVTKMHVIEQIFVVRRYGISSSCLV